MKEHILRVFENRVIGSIFGPKRAEVAAGRRILHDERLLNFYISLTSLA
jgi:hypothetical protein